MLNLEAVKDWVSTLGVNPGPAGRSPNSARMGELREFMRETTVALLTTVDRHGIMHARPVDTPEVDSDGRVWFISSVVDPILDQVGARPEVQLTYVDGKSGRCMVVIGMARVLKDTTRAAALWRPALASWFPRGPADPELAVVNVSVTSADLWD